LFGGNYITNIKSLQIAQKKIIRKIFKEPSAQHSLPLFKNLDVQPLRYLLVFKLLKMFYICGGNRTKPIEYTSKLRFKQDISLLGLGIVIPKPNNEALRQTYTYLVHQNCSVPSPLNSETKLHAYVSLEIKKMATIRVER
jgi:hypothetical protein